MANIDNSIARFSASMAEINATKKHTVMIDMPARKAVAGKTTKVFIKKAPVAPKTQPPAPKTQPPAPKTQAPAPKTQAPAPKATTTARQPIVMAAKKTAAKKSKLSKLMSNKTVFDLSH
jgi:hypothetical protein